MGTILSNILLGSRLKDATSGYQGFNLMTVELFLAYPLLSTHHFYQTELRYLLRKKNFIEVPIEYNSPSSRVSGKAIRNALHGLLYYYFYRITYRPISL